MELSPGPEADTTPVFCPYCGGPINDPNDAVKCGTCGTLHHLDCWEANGGCCKPDCPASSRRPATAAAAPTVPPPVVGPLPTFQRMGPPSLAQYGSWLSIFVILVLVVLLSSLLSAPVLGMLIMTRTADPAALLQDPTALLQVLQDPISFFLLAAVQDGVFVGVVYVLVVRRRVSSWRQMGLRAPRLRSLGWGLFYGAAFTAASAVIELVLSVFGVEQTQSAQFPLGQGGIGGTVAIWLAGVLLAPIAEEIFFRGFMFRAITARKGLVRGVIYSSLVFGFVHFNAAAFLPISVGAALLAIGYHRTDDLWVPIIAHSLNNIAAFLILTLSAGVW